MRRTVFMPILLALLLAGLCLANLTGCADGGFQFVSNMSYSPSAVPNS